jgi:hypothetical protein
MRMMIAVLLVAATVGTYAAEVKQPEKPKAVAGALSELRHFGRLPKRALLAEVKEPEKPKAVAGALSESRQFGRLAKP